MSRRFQGGVLGVGFNPLQAPNAPTGVTATAGSGQASVAFTAPTNVGGSAISSYVAISNPGNFSNTGASSPIVVSGLTNGTAYTFQVTALNSYGPSPISAASGSVTPTDPSWIGLLGASGVSDLGNSITYDASGNVYVVGASYASGNADIQVAKFNSAGVIQWQRKIDRSSGTDLGKAVAVDGSGNVYICAKSNSFALIKYDTNGTLQWQYALGSSADLEPRSIALDSSGNIYVCGVGINGQPVMQVLKYNSSGALQWQQYIYLGSLNIQGYGVAVDASGNVYACGYDYFADPCFPSVLGRLVKYNTSGTLQWEQRFSGSPSSWDQGFAIALDSSGNPYVCGTYDGNSTPAMLVMKYNSSGTLQWSRKLNGVGGVGAQGQGISVGSDGFIYAVGYSAISGQNSYIIAKYNSSGTIQLQRSLRVAAASYATSIAVSGSFMYVCGYSSPSGSSDFLIAKLPTDGSKTGTYTVGGYSYTYAASSLTDSSAGLSSGAITIGSAASGYTNNTGTGTSSTSTLTSSTTTL